MSDAQGAKKQSNQPAKKVVRPDHGENFVPGSESAPDDQAPQPLDHFKRGYKERAELRDREMGHLNVDFRHKGGRKRERSGDANEDHWQNSSHGRREDSGGRGDRETGTSGPSNNGPAGLDVTRLVAKLDMPGCDLNAELDQAREEYATSFDSGKAMTAILANLARRRKLGVALSVWQWMDQRSIPRNVFHFNSLISVCEKMKDWQRALKLLDQMEKEGVEKNEVTFSSAISSCEKSGQWRTAIDLLQRMKKEGIGRTAIAYNAAISACEKGLVPARALEIFEQMKAEGVRPTVITYSALISACEKGGQWKLALEVLEDMKNAGHGVNVIAYSATISALSKGQQWEIALQLFRQIEESGQTPSVVTYNATMTALEKGLQWERALDLFDEMKYKNLPVTVVSYGSVLSACEKGYQWQQCLTFLDEMSEVGIKKNVIIFGAAMSCMEKSCRADIAFQLMDRMKIEGVSPNVHIYNSAISACARCNLWEKGLQLFEEMERVGVVRDVVTYNAVLDAVSSQVNIARKLFNEGVTRGFYARVSRLGSQWLELDLHFLSLGGGEVALAWWFEECLLPYLGNSSKLAGVKSIDIVTGYGKTRMRGARDGGDGMRKRVRAMLRFMNIKEVEQPNKGRLHIDKEALTKEVERNGGKIVFDEGGYRKFRHEETTANVMPTIPQVKRARWGAPRREETFAHADEMNDRRAHDGRHEQSSWMGPPGNNRRFETDHQSRDSHGFASRDFRGPERNNHHRGGMHDNYSRENYRERSDQRSVPDVHVGRESGFDRGDLRHSRRPELPDRDRGHYRQDKNTHDNNSGDRRRVDHGRNDFDAGRQRSHPRDIGRDGRPDPPRYNNRDYSSQDQPQYKGGFDERGRSGEHPSTKRINNEGHEERLMPTDQGSYNDGPKRNHDDMQGNGNGTNPHTGDRDDRRRNGNAPFESGKSSRPDNSGRPRAFSGDNKRGYDSVDNELQRGRRGYDVESDFTSNKRSRGYAIERPQESDFSNQRARGYDSQRPRDNRDRQGHGDDRDYQSRPRNDPNASDHRAHDMKENSGFNKALDAPRGYRK